MKNETLQSPTDNFLESHLSQSWLQRVAIY